MTLPRPLTALALALALAVAAALAPLTGSAGAANTKQCRVAQLSASLERVLNGDGRHEAALTLTSKGSGVCDIGAYVTLSLVGQNHKRIVTHTVRVSGKHLPVLSLSDDSATAELNWSTRPGAGDRPGGPCFKAPVRLVVTLADGRGSLELRWRQGVVCGGARIRLSALVIPVPSAPPPCTPARRSHPC